MTPQDVKDTMSELARKNDVGELSNEQFTEQAYALAMMARVSLTDEEFRRVLDDILLAHQALANDLTAHGYRIPGNNPQKPN